jgi:protein required for attachment to host cells
MKQGRTWILIADAARARLFRYDPAGKGLVMALDHQFVAMRPRSGDIASDRPGRRFDSRGRGRHVTEPPTDPHPRAEHQLMREVAEALDRERAGGSFDHLVVVAPPQVLGELRAAMTAELRKLVAAEVNKDYSGLPPQDLLKHLAEILGS